MFPCFLDGLETSFVSRMSRASQIIRRVSANTATIDNYQTKSPKRNEAWIIVVVAGRGLAHRSAG